MNGGFSFFSESFPQQGRNGKLNRMRTEAGQHLLQRTGNLFTERERHRGSERKNGKAAIDSRIGANKSDTKTQNHPHHLDFFRRILPAHRFTAAATEGGGGCGAGEPPCHHFSVEVKTILNSPPLHHNLSTREAPTTICNTADQRLILGTTTQLLPTIVGVAAVERETIFRINHSNVTCHRDNLTSTHFRGTRSTTDHEISCADDRTGTISVPSSTHPIHLEWQTGLTCDTYQCGPWKVLTERELKLVCANYDRQ